MRHWSESDRLTAEASVGDSQTRQRCSSTIQVVLEIAGEGMHPLSRDILRFNLAKIALLQGDEDDAIIWLNDALAGERKELLRRFRRDGVMQQLAVKKRTTLPVKTAKALLSLGSISAIARSGDR